MLQQVKLMFSFYKKAPTPGFEPGYPEGNGLSGFVELKARAIPGYATLAMAVRRFELLTSTYLSG